MNFIPFAGAMYFARSPPVFVAEWCNELGCGSSQAMQPAMPVITMPGEAWGDPWLFRMMLGVLAEAKTARPGMARRLLGAR